MRKILTKFLIVFIILELVFSVNSFAETSFILAFKDTQVCNMGESVEVPIILHGIDIEGSGLIALSCKIEYDENNLELIPVNGDEYFELNDVLEEYASMVNFNNDTKILSFTLSSSYFSNVGSSLSDYTNFGKMKFKAKDNIYSGNYEIAITDIVMGNKNIDSTYSSIFVNGIERKDHEDVNNNIERESNLETIRQSSDKDVILNIEVSKDGKTIIVIPDENNGVIIGYLMVEGNKIEAKDGKFIIDSNQDSEYEIYIYAPDGSYLTKKYVTTYIEKNNNGNQEEKNNNSNNKDDKKSDSQDNKKSLKTGDYIAIAICGLVIAFGIIICILVIKKKNKKDEE